MGLDLVFVLVVVAAVVLAVVAAAGRRRVAAVKEGFPGGGRFLMPGLVEEGPGCKEVKRGGSVCDVEAWGLPNSDTARTGFETCMAEKKMKCLKRKQNEALTPETCILSVRKYLDAKPHCSDLVS